MNTEIYFYILPELTLEDCYRQVCHLVEKNYQYKKNIYIHMQTKAATERMNDLLWTFHDTSFLPHSFSDDNATASILLGDNPKANPSGHLLINLTPEVPKFYHQFQQVFEIVPSETTAKNLARNRYQIYKTRGCKLITCKPQNG